MKTRNQSYPRIDSNSKLFKPARQIGQAKPYKKIFFLFSALYLCTLFSPIKSQNLLPNSSFEDIKVCPTKHGQTPTSLATSVNEWFCPNNSSVDVFTPCSGLEKTTPLNIIPPNLWNGYQNARTGTNFVGIYIYPQWNEYMSTQLLHPLIAGNNYYVSFYVSNASRQKWVTDAIGMYISTNPLNSNNAYAFVDNLPQVVSTPGIFIKDTNWTKISGTYTAKGDEEYITIGCFFYARANNGASSGFQLSNHIQELPTAINPSATYPESKIYLFIDDVSFVQTISGALNVCKGSSYTYSILPVAGATSYTWTLPAGWIGTSNSDSIAVVAGANSGTISVIANDTNNTTQSIFVSVDTIPAGVIGSISGNTIACSAQSNTYSVEDVDNATSYTWTLPAGWLGESNTSIISAKPYVTSGNILVTANNACGSSTSPPFSVTIASTPVQPSVINGTIKPCSGQVYTYSVDADTNASYYTWTLPSGWSGTSISNNISATAGTTNGSIKVKAHNGCGASTERSLSVTVNKVPTQPLNIIGDTILCAGDSTTYNIYPVTNTISYSWLLPDGWIGTSDSNSISLITGTNSGDVIVTAINECGTSAERLLTVSVSNVPEKPFAILGNTTLCVGNNFIYKVAQIDNATSYFWLLPNGWSGTSDTNSISVTPTIGKGIVSVSANNACGSSPMQEINVTTRDIPAQPSTIIGDTLSCLNKTYIYRVELDSNVSLYSWELPSDWVGNSDSSSISVIAGSTGIIKVIAINECSVSSKRLLSVTGNNVPTQPTFIRGNTNLCYGNESTFYIDTIANTTHYVWTLPNGWLGTSNINHILATSFILGQGMVSVTANNYCGASPSQEINVTTRDIPAQPSVITGDTLSCSGHLYNYSVATDTNTTYYIWSLSNSWFGDSDSSSISIIPYNGSATISVTANNYCGKSIPQSLYIYLDTINTSIIQSGTQLIAMGIKDYTYTWVDCTNNFEILYTGSHIYTPARNGNYAVIISSQTGCTDTSNCISYSPNTGIAQPKMDEYLNIFPNPANNYLYVNTSIASELKTVVIYDSKGKIIKEVIHNNERETFVSLVNITSGIYIINVVFQNGQTIYKKLSIIK